MKKVEMKAWVLWDGKLKRPRVELGLGGSEDNLRQILGGMSVFRWPDYLEEHGHRALRGTFVVEVPDE